jgi:hypothetical protein
MASRANFRGIGKPPLRLSVSARQFSSCHHSSPDGSPDGSPSGRSECRAGTHPCSLNYPSTCVPGLEVFEPTARTSTRSTVFAIFGLMLALVCSRRLAAAQLVRRDASEAHYTLSVCVWYAAGGALRTEKECWKFWRAGHGWRLRYQL